MEESKARIQLQEKVQKVFQAYQKILIKAGTGAGKTKLAIDLVMGTKEPWIVMVPKIPLYQTWRDEIKKWYPLDMSSVMRFEQILCYASAHKLTPTGTGHNLVLDEAHRITDRSWPYIKAMLGTTGKLICLSATVPYKKKDLLQHLGITKEQTVAYSLDSAVEDNLVSDYRIQVIQFPLDSSKKNIEAGKKGAKFFTTEQQGYAYADQKARQALYSNNENLKKFMMLNRMRFIYNLPTKLEIAQELLRQIPANKKVIVFCGSINHANAVCQYRYHSKTTDADYQAFCEGKINQLAVVQTVAEGVNIPNIDYAVLMQVQNEDLHTIQKVGRSLRKTDDPNKCSKVIILEATGTQDSKWVANAIQSFDPTKIDYVSQSQFNNKGLTL